MKFIERIQDLPEKKRKTIFWSIIVVVGISVFVWWVKNLEMRIKSFKSEELKEELKLPSLEIEMPEISQEELKKLEEIMKESLEEYGQ